MTPQQAFGEMTDAYLAAIRRAVRQLAQRYAAEIEAWMKANRVWTDRTSNAVQSLWSDVMDVANDMIVIILSHGVNYGVWLELAHGGTYSIIFPALDYFGPRLWNDIVALMA